MSWTEEKAKLLLAHKLERKRIVLRIGLTLVVVLITGVLAHFIGEGYASKLREKELEKESRLEIQREHQTWYYQKRFDGYRAIDSTFMNLLVVTNGGINHMEKMGDSADQVSVDREMTTARHTAWRTLNDYQQFFPPSFVAETKSQLMVWEGLPRTEPKHWRHIMVFLQDLKNKLNRYVGAEYEAVLDGKDACDSLTGFELSKWQEVKTTPAEYSDLLFDYIVSNYDRWLVFSDSVAHYGDPANVDIIIMRK